ncbi:MAG: glutathione peroxidase [Armatimonadota bacterium]
MVTTLAIASLMAMKVGTPMAGSIYDFTMANIDGKPTSLKKYKGKVLLVVNVASRCGNTPQYEQLEAIYEKYQKQGLVVLGFPANNFGGQEPGTNDEIKTFCTAKYNVKFPMFSKISVKGEDIAPLYKWLLAQSNSTTDVDWNFAKFLVAKDGSTVKRYSFRLKPDNASIVTDLEAALK